MLAIAPVLGVLDLIAWQRELFSPQTGDAELVIGHAIHNQPSCRHGRQFGDHA